MNRYNFNSEKWHVWWDDQYICFNIGENYCIKDFIREFSYFLHDGEYAGAVFEDVNNSGHTETDFYPGRHGLYHIYEEETMSWDVAQKLYNMVMENYGRM